MKRFIAIIFLMIFSLQVLPVRTLGKMLAKNQLTEEVKEDCGGCDDDLSDSCKDDSYSNNTYSFDFALAIHIGAGSCNIKDIQFNDDLPNSHVKDIHCPPPNC